MKSFTKGKIVVTYHGIGKTTCAKSHDNVVDLEYGCFNINDERSKDWHKVVAKLAVSLKRQNKIVLLPCHREIRNWLNENGTDFMVVTPCLELKEQWLERLKKRYEEDPSEHNLSVYKVAEIQYDEDVRSLMGEDNVKVVKDMDYELFDILVYGVEHSLKKDVFSMFDNLVLTKNGFAKKQNQII